MAQCGFFSAGKFVFNPNLTAAQCVENQGYWVLSAQDINESYGPYSWDHGAELFAWSFAGVVGLWLVAHLSGVILGMIRRG